MSATISGRGRPLDYQTATGRAAHPTHEKIGSSHFFLLITHRGYR
jgi:hypothetical protein